jgi:NAD(P)-dependent dehydrogenase (short-subunit alcohol dehydrogenase family)
MYNAYSGGGSDMAEAPAKVALVTGANKGIGFATARQLAQNGAIVLVGARDKIRGLDAAEALVREGLNAKWLALDVTDPGSIDSAVAEVERNFGKLDVLINNAGIGLASGTPSNSEVQALRSTFETNFFGAFAVLKGFVPLIRSAAAGRIVNVSCQLGSLFHTADPQWPGYRFPYAAYSISKAALNMLTIQFANELAATATKINSVDPGYTLTDLTAGQGFAKPEDSARVIVRYASLSPDGPTGGFFNEFGRVPW